MKSLEYILQRSNELDEAISSLLNSGTFVSSERCTATLTMCDISQEHAHSFRLLTAVGNLTSAVSLMRLQFEALTRAMWLLYAASDSAIAKLQAPLSEQTEKAAIQQPSINEMFEQISSKAPPAACRMLAEFKDVSWKALNSYVHGGIHAVNRHGEGYPVPLVIQVLQNSNGLSTMAGMVLAILTGDIGITKSMSQIQQDFKDCLPPLIK